MYLQDLCTLIVLPLWFGEQSDFFRDTTITMDRHFIISTSISVWTVVLTTVLIGLGLVCGLPVLGSMDNSRDRARECLDYECVPVVAKHVPPPAGAQESTGSSRSSRSVTATAPRSSLFECADRNYECGSITASASAHEDPVPGCAATRDELRLCGRRVRLYRSFILVRKVARSLLQEAKVLASCPNHETTP